MYVSYKQSQTVLCTFFIVVAAIPNQHIKCIAKDDTKAYTPFFFFTCPILDLTNETIFWCCSAGKRNLPCVSEDIWYLSNSYCPNLLNRLKHLFLHDKN